MTKKIKPFKVHAAVEQKVWAVNFKEAQKIVEDSLNKAEVDYYVMGIEDLIPRDYEPNKYERHLA